jgi:hypothetical protein
VGSKAIEKQWLTTGLRDNNGLAALYDATYYAFADSVRNTMSCIRIQTVCRLNANPIALGIQEHDETANHAVLLAETLKDTSERGLEIAGIGQSSGNVDKRSEFADFPSLTREEFSAL